MVLNEVFRILGHLKIAVHVTSLIIAVCFLLSISVEFFHSSKYLLSYNKPAIWKWGHWCGCCTCTCTLKKIWLWYDDDDTPGPKVIKLFSCSTQLSVKFILLINLKLLIIPNTFLLNIAEQENFSISREIFMLSWVEHEKSFITSGPDKKGYQENILLNSTWKHNYVVWYSLSTLEVPHWGTSNEYPQCRGLDKRWGTRISLSTLSKLGNNFLLLLINFHSG